MNISEDGIEIVAFFEGRKNAAYPDPATGGSPWTIGIGHTGEEVVAGLTWTDAQVDEAFRADIARFEAGVTRALKLPPSQSQFDAMVALAFNVGVTAFTNSTLVRMFNMNQIDAAADQFLRWDKAAGKSMKGLRRRRAAERARFLGATGAEAIEIGKEVE